MEKISILVKKTSLVYDKISNQYLIDYNLSASQFKILMLLYHHGDLRQIDIETILGMSNPTVSGLINKLENQNLVKRISNPNDKRSKLIIPTNLALSLKEDLINLADTIEQNITANLTNSEIEQLKIILNKMIQGGNKDE